MRATRGAKGNRFPAIMTGDQFALRSWMTHGRESSRPQRLCNNAGRKATLPRAQAPSRRINRSERRSAAPANHR
jgi:hypothetical protein